MATLLSAEVARIRGQHVREQNIHEYGNSLHDYVCDRIQEVIDEGMTSGCITIERAIEEWGCSAEGWCAVRITAPCGEMLREVVNAVSAKFADNGYTVNDEFDGIDNITKISW